MGNAIDDGLGRQFTYDAAGRMTTAVTGSANITYQVGVDGLRIGKTVAGVIPQELFYAYDDQRRLLGVYAPDGLGG